MSEHHPPCPPGVCEHFKCEDCRYFVDNVIGPAQEREDELIRERDELRAERDAAVAANIRMQSESKHAAHMRAERAEAWRAVLEAQLERVQPVVEAAEKFYDDDYQYHHEAALVLDAAVFTYREGGRKDPSSQTAVEPACGIAGCRGEHWPQDHNEAVESAASTECDCLGIMDRHALTCASNPDDPTRPTTRVLSAEGSSVDGLVDTITPEEDRETAERGSNGAHQLANAVESSRFCYTDCDGESCHLVRPCLPVTKDTRVVGEADTQAALDDNSLQSELPVMDPQLRRALSDWTIDAKRDKLV